MMKEKQDRKFNNSSR